MRVRRFRLFGVGLLQCVATCAVDLLGDGADNTTYTDSSWHDFPGLTDALDRFAPTDDQVTRQIDEIRAMHAAQGNEKPRACVFVLAQAIHCGELCESPNARKVNPHGKTCTQATSVVNLARSLQRFLFDQWPYPLVMCVTACVCCAHA